MEQGGKWRTVWCMENYNAEGTRILMLRSLVATFEEVPVAVPAVEALSGIEDGGAPPPAEPPPKQLLLRRNLTMEKLSIAHGHHELMWIDAVDPGDEEIRWLEEEFHLHPAVVSDLRRKDRRPSLLVYPEYLFVSLFHGRVGKRGVEADEIHCIIGERFFITVREETATSVEGAYERAAQNNDYWRRGATYLLYLTMQFVVDNYYPLLDRIGNQLNKLEEQAMNDGGKELQRSVFRVKQQLINLRQMVAPQREVISNVIGEERLSRTNENRDLFRHLYERLLRVYDVIDSQRDLAGNVLDLIESQGATNLANAVSRLTIISMIFLPITFMVSLFGLNFVETNPPLIIPMNGWALFAVIIGIAFLIAGMLWRYFRRQEWL
jgi:magnesium transporter